MFNIHLASPTGFRLASTVMGGMVGLALMAPQARAQDPKPISITCTPSANWIKEQTAEVNHKYTVLGRTRSLAYTANASISWQPEANQGYVLNYEVKAFLGLGRQQHSTGHWASQGLSPSEFVEQGSRTKSLSVNLAKGLVKLPDATQEQALVPGSQDKLSVWAQMGWWVACAPKSFEKQVWLSMPVWGGGETERWLFQSQGWDKLDTPYGERQAVHLVRPAGMGGDARIELWYVPEWGVLPVKLLIEQANGDRAEQQLSERLPAP
jgi:Protein of unknown function (DUF3108)